MHDVTEIRTAARSLKVQMIAAGLLSASETSGRLDILIAKLDVEGFLSLRALPAFWELLALWQMPANIEQTAVSLKEQECLRPHINSNTLSPMSPLGSHTNVKAEPSATDAPHLLPHPQTLIGEVQLGGRFDKLVARLCRSASTSTGITVNFERLEDILNLPIDSLLKLDGVGKSYREDWQELKVLYFQATEFLPVPPDLSDVVEPLELVRDDMRLNLTQLDAADLKVVAKLERVIGRADIRTILNFDSLKEEAASRLGGRTRSQLMQVRARLAAELLLIAAGTLDYYAAPSSLITAATTQPFVSAAALGRFLIERVDIFLATLDEKSQLIFQHRWGFVDERLTLSEIGKRYDVSRERIRQLESKINERLNNYLALNSAEIWHAATSMSYEALRLEMADLSECFAELAHFHEFLAFISHGRIAFTGSLAHPPLTVLDSYFALHGTAIERSVILQYLQQELGGDEKDASNALQFLYDQSQVALESGLVRPLNLGKREAAAAVLAEHPNGLPWLDIARHANRRGISRSPFSEQTGGHALQDSPLMYVAGKGVYRHTRFVDFSTVDETDIFHSLHSYFATAEREVAHLSEAQAGLPELRKHDYYILRYVVKMHGEGHGIYFNGKSQTDSISLNPEFELFSQKSVILQSMRQRQAPLTTNEVAQLLKSRSLRHATLYLKQLMDANQVVQIDRMLYTTSENAYKNIDLDAMQHTIESVLRRHDKPVDPSVIQHELNALQGEAYSKYFYSSLARYFAQLGHWQRRHSLFALQPISFGSLTDAIDTLCKAENSVDKNFASLRLHIAISEEAARVSIYNWKAAKARLAAGVAVPELEDELEDELEIG